MSKTYTLAVVTMIASSVFFSTICHADCITSCASSYMSCDARCNSNDKICQAKCQDEYKRCKDGCASPTPSPSPSPTPKSESHNINDSIGEWAKFKGTVQSESGNFVLRSEENNESVIIDKNDVRIKDGIIEVKTDAKVFNIDKNTIGFGLHCNKKCCPSGDCDSTCCITDCGMSLTCKGGKADLSCKCF